MTQASNSLLWPVRQGLQDIGYTGDLIQENYAFADFGSSEPQVRQIDLAAFGHIPTSFELPGLESQSARKMLNL